MSETAEKTDPKLWEKVKKKVTASNKGGKPGQWSARKAQMAVHDYKEEGGGYKGEKTADNHLVQWGEEDWGTKSGEKSGETGERYLPKEARDALTKDEYARTTRKKRADTKKGKQFSQQPHDVAENTAPYHHHGHEPPAPEGKQPSRADLYERAKAENIPGRSRMTKADLMKALDHGEA